MEPAKKFKAFPSLPGIDRPQLTYIAYAVNWACNQIGQEWRWKNQPAKK